MYEIIFGKNATEFLEQLPKQKRKQIFDAVIKTESDPYRYFKRLRGNLGYSLTVGNVRVIADIAERRRRIEITKIEYRSRAYVQ